MLYPTNDHESNTSYLQKEVTKYYTNLTAFVDIYALSDLVIPPVDHVAIKANDSVQFEIWLKEIEVLSYTLSFTMLNNRRIATALLSSPLSFGMLGATSCLEIIEPKP